MQTLAPTGRPVPNACCPSCQAGVLYYSLSAARLSCRACVWTCALLPVEAQEMVRALAGIAALPALVARIGQRVAVVDAPPEQGLFYERGADGTGKWRIVPRGPEADGGLARLTEQGTVLNGIEVEALNREHTEFRASSQRRDAQGRPVCWYQVRVSAWTARCSCPAMKPCAHLAAVGRWLIEALPPDVAASVGVQGRDRASIQAAGQDAAELLFG